MKTNRHKLSETRIKFEARNPKFETNSNDPNIKIQNPNSSEVDGCFENLKIGISILFRISGLGFRIFSSVAKSACGG
jgi:hypothetical protein